MANNKLLSLLQTFSRSELTRFEKFIISPYFNDNEELIRFFEIIEKEQVLPGETAKKTDKLGLWRKMYQRKPYNDTRFRRLCSDLLKLALEFLSVQQFRENTLFTKLLLMPRLSIPQLDKHFAGVARQMNRELDKSGHRDTDFHYLSYMMLQKRYAQLEIKAKKSTAFEYIEQSDYHLDCYYYSKKLQLYSDILGYRTMIAGTAELRLFPGFLEFIEQSPYMEEPPVRAWYLVVLMLLNSTEEHYFRELKELVEQKGQRFQQDELQTLFIHLMNYCIFTKINNGQTAYYQELFSLYKTALDQEIIFENGELEPQHYKNIITISLHVKEFTWVEHFIQTYTHLLPASDQENALNYNLANVYFHKGEYEKVIEQLREVEYQSVVYALGSKLLMLRTYYELDEILALDSLIDSFRIYLRRNRHISKDVKQQYMNMLRFTKKLSALAPYDEEGRKKVRKQIEGCKVLAAKKWLLEKVGIGE